MYDAYLPPQPERDTTTHDLTAGDLLDIAELNRMWALTEDTPQLVEDNDEEEDEEAPEPELPGGPGVTLRDYSFRESVRTHGLCASILIHLLLLVGGAE